MAKRTNSDRPDVTLEAGPDVTTEADPRAEYDRLIAAIHAQAKLVPLIEVKSINNGNGFSTPAGEVLYKLREQKRAAFAKIIQ